MIIRKIIGEKSAEKLTRKRKVNTASEIQAANSWGTEAEPCMPSTFVTNCNCDTRRNQVRRTEGEERKGTRQTEMEKKKRGTKEKKGRKQRSIREQL